MDTLRAYLSQINPLLLKHISGKPAEFIATFQSDNFLSEEAFAQEICGANKRKDYYEKLKSRTLNILQAFAIISISQGDGEVKKKLDLCRKKFTIGHKFVNQGEKNEGFRLIKQAYRIATKYNFTHMACELSSTLHYYYTYYKPNLKMATFYADEVEKYIAIYSQEKKFERLRYQVTIANGELKLEDFKPIIKSVDALDGDSPKCIASKYIIHVLYGHKIRDYKTISQMCKKAIGELNRKEGVYRSFYHFFWISQGVVQMALGSNAKADYAFESTEAYVHKKTANDYILKYYRAVNALHAGNYQKAYNLVAASKRCKFENIREQFAIIEAYLCFLSRFGYLTLNKTFRIGKYLNETIKAQSDKQGSNIAILIAELLVYLSRDRAKFIDRVEAVNNYSYRHLKDRETRRAKQFIQILCKIPRANFNAVALRRIAKRHIQYLEKNPMWMGNNFAIEVIPFEILLNMIMAQLQQKAA